MKYNLKRINAKYHGRTLVVAPKDYPGKKYAGLYTYEHRAVFWLHHGYLPPKSYHIHHINGDHTDNRIENLEPISVKDHSREKHNGGKKEAETIRLTCFECSSVFEQLERTVRFRKSQGQTRFYCCKSCQVSASNRERTGIKLKYPKNRKSFTPMITLVCPCCKSIFERPQRVIRCRNKAGTSNFYCSRTCINKSKRPKLAVIS